ncbi:hypothetical protein I6F21_27250 [Bradyrhizobium sp. NBAIM03]|uniref:hypothetical protein n=1 Tax=unclassified Bradyrhizobium TaxID=2631580 RepID=UPI001CD1B818|nr:MULTISPECIES: hypothetical protein [unclassified Bradyrhizobium]MCA1471016.1 hypothetical protein [Bradyrhizobium sp. IC3195]MCA1536231.1 hypothetical protein [Bradyrhizobium sp. NBAIM03]
MIFVQHYKDYRIYLALGAFGRKLRECRLLAGTSFSKRPPLGFTFREHHPAVFLRVYSNHRANSFTRPQILNTLTKR